MDKPLKLLVILFIVFATYVISSISGYASAQGEVSITFQQSGISNDTSESILRIDGESYQFSQLPITFLWATSSIHGIAVADHILAIPGEKMYKFTGWTNGEGLSGNMYTVPDQDTNMTANYNTQYLMIVHARTIKPSPTLPPSNVYLNENLVGNTSETIPFNAWTNDTYSGNIGVDAFVSGGNGTRFAFLRWEDDNSTQNPKPITVHGAANYRAVYIPQYQVTFINQTVGGSITPSENAYFNLESHILMSAVPNSGHAFSHWTSVGDISFYNRTSASSMAVINGAGTITAQFTDTVLISFASSGVLSDASGPMLMVDSTPYTYSQLPKVFSWAPDSIHNVTALGLNSTDLGKRYILINWASNGRLSANVYTVPASNRTVTARYIPQYLLTVVNGDYGVASGQGWYTNGTFAVFGISPTVVSGGTAIQHVFTGWTSSDSSGYTGTKSVYGIIMYDKVTETAQWITQPVKLSPEWINLIYIANSGIAVIGALLLIKWVNTRGGKTRT